MTKEGAQMTSDPTRPRTETRTALVTGASGYIGGQLVPRLLACGWTVRVLTRRRSSLEGLPWVDRVEVAEGDVADEAAMRTALHGIHAAWYLVHSMDDLPDFARRDREGATVFAKAAGEEGVSRVVYLGGLHPHDEKLSAHLESRVEVGRILLASGVPTVVLQAGVVIGDGSASFDMLRYLTTRLPAMVAPKWLDNRVQPIGIDDVVTVLAAAADLPPDVNRAFDIGGPDVLTYRQMIQRFADLTGRPRRLVVTVPVLTPRLASEWVGLVTPVPAGIAKPLVDSLVHEVVVKDDDLRNQFGVHHDSTDFDTAVRRALRTLPRDTAWRNLAVTGAATAVAATLGALATQPDSRWYRSLDLPGWQPPRVVFPVVWTALYADLAVTSAATLTAYDRAGDRRARSAYLTALGTNLALNTAWSVVFWRARRPGLAALECALLTASSADLSRRAGGTRRRTGAAQAPYAAWCAFATVLTTAIARRNRVSE